jgi:hypothetical protein
MPPYQIWFDANGACRREGELDSVAAAAVVRRQLWGFKRFTRAIPNGNGQRAELTAVIMAVGDLPIFFLLHGTLGIHFSVLLCLIYLVPAFAL